MNAKITADVGRAIRAAKKAGASNIDCVDIVRERFGIVVNRRSIDRYLAQAVVDPAKNASSKPKTPVSSGPVDEVTDLESTIHRIKGLMAMQLTAGEFAKLSAELRQTYAQLRAVKAEKSGGKAQGPDVTQLRKAIFGALESTSGSATHEQEARPEVPDVEVASGAPGASG